MLLINYKMSIKSNITILYIKHKNNSNLFFDKNPIIE